MGSNHPIPNYADSSQFRVYNRVLCADLIKLAMIEFRKKNIPMILQVHDELLFEIKKDKTDEYVKPIKGIMENSIKLAVPFLSEMNDASKLTLLNRIVGIAADEREEIALFQRPLRRLVSKRKFHFSPPSHEDEKAERPSDQRTHPADANRQNAQPNTSNARLLFCDRKTMQRH